MDVATYLITGATDGIGKATAVALAARLADSGVVSLEGLIAFKLQGLVNDPRRSQDLEDIRAPLTAFRVAESRAAYSRRAVSAGEAFTMLDDLMAVIESLCTSWPAKPAMTRTPDLRL